MDDDGGMRFRQTLPDGAERFATAAADGQMGQIMKVYLDWQLSGDDAFLRELWPRVKRAIAFAWIPGGWDADRDGVLEGAQHNTYDVEFYGPNPLCGIYYLGALRAVEEMARVMGDDATRAGDRGGSSTRAAPWIDANLFNGEYYVQQVRGLPPRAASRHALLNTMGADDTEQPEYQVGDGLPGRSARRPVSRPTSRASGRWSIRRTAGRRCESIYRYNYKRELLRARQRAAHLRAERRSRARRLPTTREASGPTCRFRTTPKC